MKKIRNGMSIPIGRDIKKILLMTKLTVFLSLFFVIQLSANDYSQTRLTVDSKNRTVEEVLLEIEDQSEFRFFYNEQFTDLNRRVKFDIEDQSIQEVMDGLFESSDFNYKIMENNLIIITPGESQQSKTVTGLVTDTDNQPLPGVTIILRGTTNGTVSNIDGSYSISNIPANATLIFSFVGMLTQEIEVGSQSVINVSMQVDAIGIEEVVAIGYGTMKKSDLTGSVSQVKTEMLESVPVYNMEQALKVGAAGVRVTQNSGIPGGRIEVRIRGGNSMIGSNDPLYVVDGFPITGGIGFLNPSDIESVDILKDASATAIYGSRGANGVVIITSKRGRQDQKSNIELNSYFGMQQEVNRFDVLEAKDYAIIANEWLKNQGLDPYFDVDQVQNPGTDWQDEIFRNAPIHNHTITFTGSSEKTKYSLSGNYYDQEGILISTGVKRGSVRLNLDHEMKSWLKMGVNLQLSRRERFSVSSDNGFRGTGLLSAAASAPPTLPVYNDKGLPYEIEQEYNFGSADMRNPLVYASRKNRSFSNSVLGNATFDVKLTSELSFRLLLGSQYDYSLGDNYTPIIYSSDRGSASISNSYSNSFLNENTLTYAKVFNEIHNLNVVGGYTYQTNMYRNTSNISVSGFANNTTENYDLSAAETIGNPSSGYSDWTLASFLARANYSFNDKYMLTASIRADGSSRFGADHKWGYFPSAAVAWRISEETFMEDVTFINSLKIRASYGITGNTALSPYQSLNRLNSVKFIYSNQADVIGFVPTGISNSDLKWETTGQLDIGFDLNILNNRLRFVFDYYKKNTKDLLASVPLPPSVGFGSILKNLGEIQNQGFELSINADILQREFKWNASAQISTNKNKVIEIAGDSDIFGADQGAAWPPINIARVGEPLGAFYGFLEDGLDEDGFIKYQDLSGPDGVPDGAVNALDRIILGSYYPDLIYGFTSDFKYKNFELNLILEGVYGNEIFNATNGTNLNSFQRGNNQLKEIMGNYWIPESPDPNAKYPKISAATQITGSERFIEDGSYLRVKSLKLAYNLPVQKMGQDIFDLIQIYISGSNLLTFTNYTGLDPEVNSRGSDSGNVANRLWMGVDQNAYPNAKVYAVGLKLSF
ncbi:TonB-dependent receptor [Draconibacterium sp.]|nr:TonB-dependent receptor [Draconibacterium sp.]